MHKTDSYNVYIYSWRDNYTEKTERTEKKATEKGYTINTYHFL